MLPGDLHQSGPVYGHRRWRQRGGGPADRGRGPGGGGAGRPRRMASGPCGLRPRNPVRDAVGRARPAAAPGAGAYPARRGGLYANLLCRLLRQPGLWHQRRYSPGAGGQRGHPALSADLLSDQRGTGPAFRPGPGLGRGGWPPPRRRPRCWPGR